jgi:hypothetical protein
MLAGRANTAGGRGSHPKIGRGFTWGNRYGCAQINPTIITEDGACNHCSTTIWAIPYRHSSTSLFAQSITLLSKEFLIDRAAVKN